jgi:hypothetical protein
MVTMSHLSGWEHVCLTLMGILTKYGRLFYWYKCNPHEKMEKSGSWFLRTWVKGAL